MRLPLDTTINRRPRDATRIKPAAGLALDRANAAVRTAVAATLDEGVLHRGQKALAARDEARRMRDAARRAKAERKTRTP